MTTKVHIINAGPNDISVWTCYGSPPTSGKSGKANSSDQRVIPGQHVELYVHSEQDIRVAELAT